MHVPLMRWCMCGEIDMWRWQYELYAVAVYIFLWFWILLSRYIIGEMVVIFQQIVDTLSQDHDEKSGMGYFRVEKNYAISDT